MEQREEEAKARGARPGSPRPGSRCPASRATSSTPCSPRRTRTSSATRGSTGRPSRSRSRRTSNDAVRPGRDHDHAAARQEPLLRDAQEPRPQGEGARRDALAGGGPREGSHPRPLPEPHRVGRRDLRLRGGRPPLVRQAGGGPLGDGGRGPRGDDPEPAPHQPAGERGAARAGHEARTVAHGAGRLHRPRRGRPRGGAAGRHHCGRGRGDGRVDARPGRAPADGVP